MLCDSFVVAIEFSEFYVAIVTSDMKIWIFSQRNLNLVKVYDESATISLDENKEDEPAKLRGDLDRK